MIGFRLDGSPDSVGFALSPLTEAVASLHVLLFPKVHAVQHPWIRAMRRVSPALRREIRAFSFLYEDAFPDCFIPPLIDARVTWEQHLARVRALADDEAAYELARPLFHYAEADAGGAERLAEAAVRRRVVEFARGSPGGEAAAELAAAVLDEPRVALERLLRLLERYWEEAFGEEWARLQPLLEGAIAEGRLAAAADGAVGLLAAQPELRLEGDVLVRPRRTSTRST